MIRFLTKKRKGIIMIQPMINQIAPIDYRSIGRGRWQEEDEREKEEEQRRRRRRRGFRYIARQGMIKLRHLSILNMMEHSWAPGARKREAFVAFLLWKLRTALLHDISFITRRSNYSIQVFLRLPFFSFLLAIPKRGKVLSSAWNNFIITPDIQLRLTFIYRRAWWQVLLLLRLVLYLTCSFSRPQTRAGRS